MTQNLCDDDGVFLTIYRGEVCRFSGLRVNRNRTTMRAIAEDTARKHGLRLADLVAPSTQPGSRARCVAHPRQEAMWRMVQASLWSRPQIGMFLGGRDHTTVIHGERAHQKRLDEAQAEAEGL